MSGLKLTGVVALFSGVLAFTRVVVAGDELPLPFDKSAKDRASRSVNPGPAVKSEHADSSPVVEPDGYALGEDALYYTSCAREEESGRCDFLSPRRTATVFKDVNLKKK